MSTRTLTRGWVSLPWCRKQTLKKMLVSEKLSYVPCIISGWGTMSTDERTSGEEAQFERFLTIVE